MKLDSLTGVAPPFGALPARRLTLPGSAGTDRAVGSTGDGRVTSDERAAAAAAELARETANRELAQKSMELAFEFDDELGRVIARLVDTQTHEVIRQVPSEELLAIARALANGQRRGSLVRSDA